MNLFPILLLGLVAKCKERDFKAAGLLFLVTFL